MKVALLQYPLVWENPAANRKAFEERIKTIEKVDLILLPEMFSTGFTMSPEKVAETMDGATVGWMREMASESDAAIAGSLVMSEDGNFYNRLLFVEPSGRITSYDKRHLFSLAGEHRVYKPGTEKVVVEFRGFKICLQVCYDLRFPAFSRNVEDYDLLVYVANWPQPRIQAWNALLKARAIENMCYVAAVNRTGNDDTGHNYPGHSQIVDYLGNYVCEPSEQEGVIYAALDRDAMLESRKKFGFLDDRDQIIVK